MKPLALGFNQTRRFIADLFSDAESFKCDAQIQRG